MGHMIESTDGMLSVREMPWMGLLDGQVNVLPDHPTREEAQRLVHPWEPVETPIYKRVPVVAEDGSLTEEFVEVDGYKGLERSDNGDHLSVVSSTYGVITNNEMWDVAEAVGKIGTDIKIETAGSLEGGRKVWILLRLTEPLKVKGDPNGGSVAFLAFQNSLDGSSSFRAQAVNTRIVCANTSAASDVEAKRNGYEFRFKHTSGIRDRMEDAKAAVAMWREGVGLWQNAMDALAATRVTEAQREAFIEQFQPMPPQHLITDRVRGNVEQAREELRSIFNSPTQEGIGLTAFGLYQAGIEWSDHFRQVKGKDGRARMESYFKRNMLNDTGLRKQVLTLAQEAAHA